MKAESKTKEKFSQVLNRNSVSFTVKNCSTDCRSILSGSSVVSKQKRSEYGELECSNDYVSGETGFQ